MPLTREESRRWTQIHNQQQQLLMLTKAFEKRHEQLHTVTKRTLWCTLVVVVATAINVFLALP